MLAHPIDRPSVHGVVDLQLFLRLAAEQFVNRKTSGFAEDVPLRNVDGRKHASVRATPGLVGDVVEEVLPETFDLRRVLADDVRGEFFESAAMRFIAGIGFTETGDALVGVQPYPRPVGLDSRHQVEIRAEAYGFDFGDLQRSDAIR